MKIIPPQIDENNSLLINEDNYPINEETPLIKPQAHYYNPGF
jgi:hypothetical protein